MERGRPEYSCQAVSYAPFLITVRFAVTLEDEGGSGETVLRAWHHPERSA